MAVLRYEKLIPEAYMENSRDFQVLARLLTLGINASKFNVDSLLYQNTASKVNSALLPLMQTKVGFFTKKDYYDSYIREVCEQFTRLVRIKGTKRSIIQAVYLFFRILNIKTTCSITIDNNKYQIDIGLQATITNTDILQEILNYILPIGYVYTIYFYDDVSYITSLHVDTSFIHVTMPQTFDSDSTYDHTSDIFTDGEILPTFYTDQGQVSTYPSNKQNIIPRSVDTILLTIYPKE